MIARITRFYIREYSDNGQRKAYCEWTDHKGRHGRTEGPVPAKSAHMTAMLDQALSEGVSLEREVW